MNRDRRLAPPARPDDRVVQDALAAPTAQEAEESVRYWRQRLTDLPAHRRRDRREARELLARWQQRRRDARRREGSEHPIEPLLDALADRLPSPRALVALATTVTLATAVVIIVVLITLVAFWPDIEPLVNDVARLTEGVG